MKKFWKKSILETKKTFSYKKDNVNLSFTLNVDNRTEMETFIELLEKAVIDIQEEIEREIL